LVQLGRMQLTLSLAQTMRTITPNALIVVHVIALLGSAFVRNRALKELLVNASPVQTPVMDEDDVKT